jgi:hypothetical protein
MHGLFASLRSSENVISYLFFAGVDGFADSRKLSVFAAISTLVHQHDYLPIELLTYLVCGTGGASDVTTSYHDPSWQHRNKAYDDMSPDDIKAAARAARQHAREHGPNVITAAFRVIAPENSPTTVRLQHELQRAAQASRKRKLEALGEDSDSDDSADGTARASNQQDEEGHDDDDDDELAQFLGA